MLNAWISYGLVAGSVGWLGLVAPHVFDLRTQNEIAFRLSQGELYDAKVLDDALAAIPDGRALVCDGERLRSLNLLAVRRIEMALATGDLRGIERYGRTLASLNDQLLACAPTQAIGWLVLFWRREQEGNLLERSLDLLAMSVRLAPYESWVAARRCYLMMPIYDILPDALKRAARDDFAYLLKVGAWTQAVNILAGPGYGARAQLARVVAELPINARLQVTRRLASQYPQVDFSKIVDDLER